jgi:hypothetical protein
MTLPNLHSKLKCRTEGGKGREGGWGQGGEMTQTMYAHANKRIKEKKLKCMTLELIMKDRNINRYSGGGYL